MVSTTLSALLDEAFRACADRRSAAPLTHVRSQADFLGVSSGQYSRIRNGKAPLSESSARKWASLLLPSDPARLERDLLTAARHRTPEQEHGSLGNAIDLFKRFGREGALLAIEYRDLPRAEARGRYAKLAEDAGEAIARGLHVAMFQPFCTPDVARRSDHCEAVRTYVAQLGERVRLVFAQMRDHALALTPDDPALKELVKSRIILYESTSQRLAGSGIQSRLFYAAMRTLDGFGLQEEVWEWVASMDDSFIRRDPNSTPVLAISEQFFPITAFWRAHGRLPLAGEIESAAKKHAAESEAAPTYQSWEVFAEGNNDAEGT